MGGGKAAKDFTLKQTKDTKDSEINTLTSELRALRASVVKRILVWQSKNKLGLPSNIT